VKASSSAWVDPSSGSVGSAGGGGRVELAYLIDAPEQIQGEIVTSLGALAARDEGVREIQADGLDAHEDLTVLGGRSGEIAVTDRFDQELAQFAANFDGARIDALRPDEVCRRGIGRTFQLVRPFPALSVEDNVLIGALLHRPDVAAARRAAHEVLGQLELFEKRHQVASALTLPDRKRLEVARALATEPKLLLLDEVMAGLRPAETDRMVAILTRINRESGLTILLIEHVMRAVMALAQDIVVLHHGEIIARGAPAEVVRDPAVLAALSTRHSFLLKEVARDIGSVAPAATIERE
jgi:branched-chain amino acid transport system ATP-binding protein